MDDELKYVNLKNQLNRVRVKLNSVLDNYDKLIVLAKESIIIDDEVDGYNEFKEIETKLNNIKNNLTTEVIPRINDKI